MLLQCCSNAASHCRNGVLVQCLSALRQCLCCCNASAYCRNAVSMLVLPQYCCNADAACNALQHCYNIEAHCRNAPFVASLWQCCYCKRHCGNALWHCRNTPIFSRCCVGKTLKSVSVCLQCPVFNALGAAVPRPQSVAGRWATRCAERRVAWPSRRRRFFFSLSYCVGKTLKSVNVCLQRPISNASGLAVPRPQSVAGRWAGQRTERRVAWPWRRPECNFLSCFGRMVCGKTRCRGKTGVAMQCTPSHLETLRTAPLKTP